MFRKNPLFEEEIQAELGYRAGLRAVAEVARARAEALGPRIMGRGSQAFQVQSDLDGVRVVNTDHGGHLAEWGSVNNAPYAPLRRGVRAAGMRLEEK